MKGGKPTCGVGGRVAVGRGGGGQLGGLAVDLGLGCLRERGEVQTVRCSLAVELRLSLCLETGSLLR